MSKVQLKRIDPITGEITGDANPVTLAEYVKIGETNLLDYLGNLTGLDQITTINNFMHNQELLEMGTTCNSVVLSWELNKTPKLQKINDIVIDNSLRRYTFSTTITIDTDFTLEVTDQNDKIVTKTITLKFSNGVYFGSYTSTSNYSTLIARLQRDFNETKERKITFNSNDNQYMYFCCPTRLGECKFSHGGFEGGFSNVSTVSYTNSKGFKEDYYIYRSNNHSLGEAIISIY